MKDKCFYMKWYINTRGLQILQSGRLYTISWFFDTIKSLSYMVTGNLELDKQHSLEISQFVTTYYC